LLRGCCHVIRIAFANRGKSKDTFTIFVSQKIPEIA